MPMFQAIADCSYVVDIEAEDEAEAWEIAREINFVSDGELLCGPEIATVDRVTPETPSHLRLVPQ